jgi:hypothetical protein
MATDNATATTTPDAPAVTRTRAKPLLASAAIVLALGIGAMVWHATGHHAPGAVSASHGSDGVKTVRLDGFNGNVAVGETGSAQIAATAQPVNGDVAPGLEFHLDDATRTLTLACYDQQTGNGPIACPATQYKVSVPAGIGVTLQLLNGQASLTGLSGPVSVTAASAYVDALGLKTSDFTAAITNGTLNATLLTAPTHVDVSVTSAQATLHLPGTVSYAVQQQTTSAYVQVTVPQSPSSTHSVLAKADNGEISLLTG